MKSLYSDIHDFHQKFGLPPISKTPAPLTPELLRFRVNFMLEEISEYEKAALNGDLEGQLDALVDLVYVALGTAYLQRMPFNTAWERVHEANMKKVRAEHADQSKRGSSFDVVKPEGWKPPRHTDLVYNEDIAIFAFSRDISSR